MTTLLLALLLSADITSFRDAAATIDRAASKRHVPASLSFRVEGVVRQVRQSPRPAEPYLQTKLTQVVTAHPDSGRYAIDEISEWPNFTSQVTQHVEDGELTTIRSLGNTRSTTKAGTDAAVARITRRHPDLLLDAAKRSRASLRSAGLDKVRIVLRDQGLVTITFLDAMLVAADWIAYDAVLGDVSHRVEYMWADGEPAGFRQLENGQLVMTAKYADVRRGDASKVATDSPAQQPRVEELAADVFLLRNAGGNDYHSLIVRFRDRLVVVEAPRSPQAARAAIATIRAWDPARPIDAVVATHHHDDHIGGLRAYAESGVRVITTAGNVEWIRSLLAAPHTIQPLAAVNATVVAAHRDERFHDDTNELVLLNPGPNDHVAESLIAWLPRQQIVFQGDLFRHDPQQPEAARDAAVALERFITKRQLTVRTIAGVHGEPASMADLHAAIARRSR